MKKNFIYFNDGEIKRKDNTIYFETDKNKRYIPIEDISDIFVFGELTLNKSFFNIYISKEILMHFFQLLRLLFRNLLSKRTFKFWVYDTYASRALFR